MEHNTSILSSVLQKGPVTKNQGGLGPVKVQGEDNATKFGEVVRDALLSAQINTPGQDTSLVKLEQQIVELSAETETLLVSADPEAVEGILSQAVAQLWELIGSYDAQNGTQFVSELSEQLTEVAITPEGIQGATDPEDIQGAVDIAELFSATFIQPANSVLAQTVVSEVPIPAGRVEMQSLTFVQPQPQPQAGHAPLFANVINLLSQSLTQNGPKPGPAPQAIANAPVNAPVIVGIQLLPKAAFDWPQQIQQFVVETPSKKQTLESTVSGQLVASVASTVGRAGTDTIQLSRGDAVKAKVKELLAVSAQTIVSSANASVVLDENPGQVLQTRTELQNVNASTLPEHTRPARSFSQNVASQIQGKPINEGITRIELAPRGLGSVIIELQTKGTGDIQIIVKAENPAVLHALRTDREALLSVLSNEISSQDGVDLEFEEFSGGPFNRDEDGLNSGDEFGQSELENEDDAESDSPASTTQQLLGVGQIDILT